MLNALITFVRSSPILFFFGAVLLFVVGLASGYFMGNDNALEEISEMLLKKFYHVDIEFTADVEVK